VVETISGLPRQSIYTIFCGWSITSPKEKCMKMNRIYGSKKYICDKTSILPPLVQFLPLSFPILLHHMMQSSQQLSYFQDALLVKPDQFFDLYPPQLIESLIQKAETFLARRLKSVTDLETLDDLCLAAFNSNALKLDSERTVSTSANARKHIYRAYYQVQLSVLEMLL